MDIDYFENKDSEEKIDYNKYSQHEELLSHIKRSIAENFRKTFCKSVYQGCIRDLRLFLSDVNEAISCCNHSYIQIPLTSIFTLIQQIFLPNATKSNKEMRISTDNLNSLKMKAKKLRRKKISQYEDQYPLSQSNPSNPKIAAGVSPNSPYLRKFRSQFVGIENFEVLGLPNVETINSIFGSVVEFFFKKIHDTNYFVSHCTGFECVLEKIRELGQEQLIEYLHSAKKNVTTFFFFILGSFKRFFFSNWMQIYFFFMGNWCFY